MMFDNLVDMFRAVELHIRTEFGHKGPPRVYTVHKMVNGYNRPTLARLPGTTNDELLQAWAAYPEFPDQTPAAGFLLIDPRTGRVSHRWGVPYELLTDPSQPAWAREYMGGTAMEIKNRTARWLSWGGGAYAVREVPVVEYQITHPVWDSSGKSTTWFRRPLVGMYCHQPGMGSASGVEASANLLCDAMCCIERNDLTVIRFEVDEPGLRILLDTPSMRRMVNGYEGAFKLFGSPLLVGGPPKGAHDGLLRGPPHPEGPLGQGVRPYRVSRRFPLRRGKGRGFPMGKRRQRDARDLTPFKSARVRNSLRASTAPSRHGLAR